MSQNQEETNIIDESEETIDDEQIEMEIYKRQKVAYTIVKESQESEVMATNEIPVSVFRLKLLEAQLQENISEHVSDFSQGFDQVHSRNLEIFIVIRFIES